MYFKGVTLEDGDVMFYEQWIDHQPAWVSFIKSKWYSSFISSLKANRNIHMQQAHVLQYPDDASLRQWLGKS